MKENTALFVIDVQHSFFQKDYWDDAYLPEFETKLRKIIDHCVVKNIPIVCIMHADGSGPFDPEKGLVKPMDFISDVKFANTFLKNTHGAFTNPELKPWLDEQGITNIIITGIRSEQCCETTTRTGSDLGYNMDYVTEATLTFPMTHARTQKTFSVAEIKEKTELVLENRFARILTVAECLESL